MKYKAIFVLIIGIDRYESEYIPSLTGAVADARALKTYLVDHLGASEDRIAILENKAATRAGIIRGFEHLSSDPRLQIGDPILVFYAGYGSQAVTSSGCSPAASVKNIQVILPYDVLCKVNGKVVEPIPNCTLRAFLDDLAQEKGNNITFILDTCHSTFGT
ncbi:hypothetical protein CPB84DRAFT_1690271, partial [Gymnopilus junonius]